MCYFKRVYEDLLSYDMDLGALNAWNYVMNNLRAALRHTQTKIDASVTDAIFQAPKNFLV